MNLTAIATGITALTLIVTNLTALYKAIAASGAISALQDRLNDHSRRISATNAEVIEIAKSVEPPK